MITASSDGWTTRGRANPKPLNTLGCPCSSCKYVLQNTCHLTGGKKGWGRNVSIKIGDRVLVQGLFTGIVKYVGDLDSGHINAGIFIGVKLDDAVGKSDGIYQGKRFFRCPESHGVIVPIHHVHLLIPREGCTIRKGLRQRPSKPSQRKSCASIANSDPEEVQAPLVPYVAASSPKISLPNLAMSTKYRPTPLKCGIRRDSKDTHFPSPTGIAVNAPQDQYKGNPNVSIMSASSLGNTSEMPDYKSTDKGSKSSFGHTASGINSGMNLSNTKSGGTSVLGTQGSTPLGASNSQIPYSNLGFKPSCENRVERATDAMAAPFTSGTFCVNRNNVKLQDNGDVDTPVLIADIYHYRSSSSSDGGHSSSNSEPCVLEDSKLQLNQKWPADKITGSGLADGNEYDFSRILLSGLTARDSSKPTSKYSLAVNNVEKLKENLDMWGGGEKGFHMALTLQKLHAAKLKGKKEMQWQKELLAMDQDEEFAARRKVLNTLKEEIFAARKKVAKVEDQVTKNKHVLKQPNTAEMAELKLKIKKLQKKNIATLGDLNHHPVGSPEIVRDTIARITAEYREKKRKLSEIYGGHALLQCS